MAQDGIHFVQDALGESRLVNLEDDYLLQYLLFFDLQNELKSQETLLENEQKIKINDKENDKNNEGDITFDEDRWAKILQKVSKSSPFSKFKDIQNGSLILI